MANVEEPRRQDEVAERAEAERRQREARLRLQGAEDEDHCASENCLPGVFNEGAVIPRTSS